MCLCVYVCTCAHVCMCPKESGCMKKVAGRRGEQTSYIRVHTQREGRAGKPGLAANKKSSPTQNLVLSASEP
jgi:hypothetical protein